MSQPDPVETFLLEAEDLLAQIEQSALDVSNDPRDVESINRLFRAFHTIKGSGSMFGFDEVAAFTHHIESTLDQARDGKLAMSPQLIELILVAKDLIKVLLEGGDASPCQGIIERFSALRESDAPGTSLAAGQTRSLAEPGEMRDYRIGFRPAPGIAHTGLDPASLLDELRGLGECALQLHTDAVPTLEKLTADQCYLAWTVALRTDKGVNAIRDVFIFVEDDCELQIEATDQRPLPTLVSGKESQALEAAAPVTGATGHVEKSAAAAPSRKATASAANVRVPSEKLDRLVNLVGELVMNQSRLLQVAATIDAAELAAPVEAIERLVGELRDSVLGIRMMPIGSTFSRFRRLVHDLSHELGKEIELVTEGEETELDKTVLDQLGDPLVHLIRNSVDHGLESPEVRAAQGKRPCGTIRLAAVHEGGQVVVTIQDDGKGLDVEKLRAKAVEKGLIQPESNLPQSELFNLIFLPGFSTASKVTNVSGRGVGMDAVKRQIEALRGSIKVQSARDVGTTILLTLPLTLAIIDGLLVEIGADRFILPMSAVTENVEISRSERAANNGRNLVKVRGELVPYLRLRELFNTPGEAPELEKIVIANFGPDRIGFVVDRVLGSHQTVIQSLGRFYEDIESVSGATIMGDGRVALILDIAGIVRHDAKGPRPHGESDSRAEFGSRSQGSPANSFCNN